MTPEEAAAALARPKSGHRGKPRVLSDAERVRREKARSLANTDALRALRSLHPEEAHALYAAAVAVRLAETAEEATS